MSLQIHMTVAVRPDRNDAFQKSVRKLIEIAGKLDAGMYWSTYETHYGALSTWHITSDAEFWSDLSRRGNVRTYIQNMLGERKGRSMLDDLTSSIVSVQEHVKRPMPELSYLPDQLDGSLTMAVLHLVRARLGAAQHVEGMIRALALAIPKVDDRERMVTQLNQVGTVGVYSVTRWGQDEADLDGQLTPIETLQRVYGADKGQEIWQRGMSALESAERWILGYRGDLSHPRQGALGIGAEIISP